MRSSKSVVLFSSRPLASAVLAVLLVAIGLIFVSGLVPTSPNHKYFPGHEWLLAIVCWALALFIGYCAAKGRKPERQEEGS
jgi:hypothetical protein